MYHKVVVDLFYIASAKMCSKSRDLTFIIFCQNLLPESLVFTRVKNFIFCFLIFGSLLDMYLLNPYLPFA